MATGTISKNVGSYDTTDYAWHASSNMSNGYNGPDNTTYAQISLTRNENAVTYVYWIFDSLSSIPADATIDSVSCTCKCSISNTASARVATRQAQLYSGTTAMGSAYTVANSTDTFSIPAGTWTRAQLQNARLRLYAVRGTSSTTTNYFFRFYGASITVNYTYQGVSYQIRVKQNGTWVSATKVMVKQNGSWVEATSVKAKDNGTWH